MGREGRQVPLRTRINNSNVSSVAHSKTTGTREHGLAFARVC